jgi:streptogramin lyase
MAAVLAGAGSWLPTALRHTSTVTEAEAGPPGAAIGPKSVIIQARARAHRRRTRIAIATAPFIGAAGGLAAADGLPPHRKPQTHRHSRSPQKHTRTGTGSVPPRGVIASDGGDLLVFGNHSMTRLNTTTGALVQRLNYQFGGPDAMTSTPHNIWIANFHSNSVTDLNPATGTVHVLRGPNYQFDGPDAMTSTRNNIWVANFHSNSVTDLNLATGTVHVLQGANYQFDGPDAMTSTPHNIWIANFHSNSVTDLNLATGAVHVLHGPNYQFDGPDAMTSTPHSVWIANFHSNSVTDLDPATGATVTVITVRR